MCIVNPAHVVAVPQDSGYNKMRVCEYYPVRPVEYDDDDQIIEDIQDGDELEYFEINYQGVINTDLADQFTVQIPVDDLCTVWDLDDMIQEIENKTKL